MPHVLWLVVPAVPAVRCQVPHLRPLCGGSSHTAPQWRERHRVRLATRPSSPEGRPEPGKAGGWWVFPTRSLLRGPAPQEAKHGRVTTGEDSVSAGLLPLSQRTASAWERQPPRWTHTRQPLLALPSSHPPAGTHPLAWTNSHPLSAWGALPESHPRAHSQRLGHLKVEGLSC